MSTELGNTSPSILMRDGSVITFINNKLINRTHTVINYKYTQIGNDNYGHQAIVATANEKRILYFYSSFQQSVFSQTSGFMSTLGAPVPYVPFELDTVISGDMKSAKVLYEVFYPQIARINDLSQLTFCTTVKDINVLQGKTDFDPDLSYNILGDKDLNGDVEAIKAAYPRGAVVFCTAMVHWRHLNFSSEIITKTTGFVPFIRKVLVLNYIPLSEYTFVGGSGGGLSRHSHESNSNSSGGYAYGVFAPGTSLKPISWY